MRQNLILKFRIHKKISSLFQKQSGKGLIQSKLAFNKKPIKIFQDSPESQSSTRQKTHEAYVQASPKYSEAEVQTECSSWQESQTDSHNDSGVGTGDIDQEAYDLMVKGTVYIESFFSVNVWFIEKQIKCF